MKKPIIVSMISYATSGGYYISAPATKIVAQPGTTTGSIGVITGKIVTQGLWEKLGIYWRTLQKGKNADMWSTSSDFNSFAKERLNNWVDRIYDHFLKLVAEGRGLSIEHVTEIAKGRIWSGSDAKKYGLVDELGGLKKAIEVAKKEANLDIDKKIKINEFPHEKDDFNLLWQLITKLIT